MALRCARFLSIPVPRDVMYRLDSEPLTDSEPLGAGSMFFQFVVVAIAVVITVSDLLMN
jgi:hypothetical protein